MLFVSFTFAADYYWVGGAGNWSDVNLHWSSTSGGAPDRSIVPGTGDDVYFDANSGLLNNTLVTLPAGAHAYCRNMSWAGVTTAAIFRYGAPAFQLQINGNLELSSTVAYGLNVINFTGGGNATFKTNGAVRINTAGFYNSFVVNKPGGSLTLLDGIAPLLAVQTIALTTGTLNMSGQSHTFGNLTAAGSTVRSINISNATILATGTWDTRGSNLTFNATGSTVTAEIFHSMGLTFAKVFVNRNNPDMDINSNTFAELTLNSPVSPIGSQRIGANNTIGKLEFKGGGRIAGAGNVIGTLILATGKGYIFHGNNTINTAMQANTADCDALGELRGIDANAKLTFGAGATADIRNVLITSLTAAGGITPIAVVGEDGGGNTGFDISPRTGGNATLYWVGGGGEWDDRAHWSFTSGGPGGACVPFITDNVIFDANSGFTSASKTVTTTSTSRCHDMTWTNVANSPIFDMGGYPMEIWGSIKLDPTLTLSSANTQYVRGIIQLKGTEASTFTSNGASLGNPLFNIEKTGANGGLTLLDDLTFPACSLRLASGKLLMPGRTINIAEIRSQTTLVRSIDFSNATITVNDWANDSRNCTFVNSAANSFITAKVYFVANGLAYPKVYCSTNLNVINIVNTTIDELVFTNTSPTSAITALSGAGNNTIGTLDVRCGGVTFMGNNTITNLLLAPARTYYFRGRQTINGLFRFNNPDCDGLGELRGIAGTSPTINFGPAATRDFNNVYLQNMTATGSGVPISVAGADAGGNTGFNITSSGSGPRYWVGGSGDWNESAHWSTTSGGPGGACVPTVSNDVFFNANSFTAGSSAVTIAQGNAYCRNMDWTGANFSPSLTKPATLSLEIWGNLVMNANTKMDAALILTGPSNTSITSNGTGTGALQFIFTKPLGYTVTLTDNFSNPLAYFFPRSGGIDMSNRTVSLNGFDNSGASLATDVNITGANITGAWSYQGALKTLQATNSVIKARRFLVDGGTYNIVDATGGSSSDSYLTNTTVNDLLFSNPSALSAVFINSNNTIGRLEFKGKGTINGTGNTIETLIFSPGKVYTFLSGSNTTITKDWFGSGTPCNLTEINSTAAGAFTVTKTNSAAELDYVRLRNITAAGTTPFKALEHSEDLGGNTNWNISPYNNTTPILGLGPDKTLCAGEFPYTIKTDGFFASPQATFTWGDGSKEKTLIVNSPGTYTVTVSYPDGCSRPDQIVITRSDVLIAPITGTANVCVGAVTNLSTSTAGGTWSSSNTAIATVSATGAVTGVTAGTADIIYTLTNGNGCTGTLQQTITVNAMPTVAATTGPSSVFVGDNISLSNATAGGVWSSSNTAVATVSTTGTVTGVTSGTTDIVYTVTGTGGCAVASTSNITVDAFDPAKRVLGIVKTTDAAEPATHGGFRISLPSGINAVEDITVTYTTAGTAIAPADYATLTGTAVITAGQNGVTIPVTIVNDTQIESTETVIATLTAGTSATYTYTIDGAAANATVQITDDDNIAANRLLSATAQLNANEPANTGTFTIALPAGVLAPENITVAYTLSGTAANGVDYETLSGTATIPAGQNSAVINVKALDDQVIEQTKDIILTVTGGTTATAGNFGVNVAAATLLQTDNDYTAATRLLAVTSNSNAAEPGTHSSFSISLPAGYVSSLPVAITYSLTGTAAYGTDYNSTSATTIILPAGQNSVSVPVNVINDDLIEQTETVILTVGSGTASQGGNTVFTLNPDPASSNASLSIIDDDNTAGNRTLAVTAQNGAEPATNGSFTFSLPAGIRTQEAITVNYTVSGTATPGSDYTTLGGTAVIPAGAGNVVVPLNIIDNSIIESTETVVLTVTGGASANFNYTPAAGNSSATASITDDDAAANSTVVLLTKVSDAVEGGANGQYRISLPPGVSSTEDISVSFSTTGSATLSTDYSLLGLSAGNIVIPAGTNQVFIDVNAVTDALVEGPETVALNLIGATSASYTYTIDPAGNGAVVNIIDVNATNSPALQVIAGTNAAEPAANATFTVKLAAAAQSAWPVIVGYKISGTAISGLDYQSIGTVIIPANQNSVTVTLHVKDDQIIEPTETVNFEILSGSTFSGTLAYIFPSDPANKAITINIADDDATAANQVLKVVKTADAAEPNTNGSFTLSLPSGYTAATPITIGYDMSGAAVLNTDYTMSALTFPAYQNSVVVPFSVLDDKLIEGPEVLTLTLKANAGQDGNTFTYSRSATDFAATASIADDDDLAANRVISLSKIADATESGTDGSFAFNLPAGVTAAVPVTLNFTLSGTAASGTDYNALTGTATIPAGQPGVAVMLTAVDDQVIEPTETVVVTFTGGTGGGQAYTASPAANTATLNITDNDNTPADLALYIATVAHVQESAAAAVEYTISLPAGLTASEDVTVNYTISGTATADEDYVAFSGTAIIPAGQNSILLSTPVLDDRIMEQNEKVVVTLAGGSAMGYTFGGTANSTVAIMDDENSEPANRTFVITTTADGAEPTTNGNFRIALPGGITTAEPITVNYTVAGTATAGSDYTALSGTAFIAVGQNGVDLPVTVIDDKVMEQTETVVVTLNGGTWDNFPFPATGSATVNITDDENGLPANKVLTISKTADAAEPGTNGGFSVSLPAGLTLTEDVTVNYTIAGTATAGTDYAALSGTAIIPAGQNSVSIPVAVINDQLLEVTETVTATLTGGTSTNFTFTASGSATVNITDDESSTPANLILSISKDNDAAEPATHGGFIVSLPAGLRTSEAITVQYTVSGTATANTDYTALSGTVVIPAGQNGAAIPVTVANDNSIEGTETVTAILSGGTSTSFTFTGTTAAMVNIADDDDVATNRVLSITKLNDAAEPSTAGRVSFALPAGITATQDITVNYTISGTATPGADYAALPGTATILAGRDNVTIPVSVIDDQLIETLETVTITLTGGTSPASVYTGAGNVTVNISDEESLPANLVLNISKDTDAAEPSTNGGFIISLPENVTATGDIIVSYALSGTATAGIDYEDLSGTTVIPVGSNSISLPVTVTDDQLIEGDETLTVSLTGGTSSSHTFTSTGIATVNITDDENTTANKVLAISKTTDAAEPATNGSFSISLPAGITATEDITANYTVAGTARAGTDYIALNGTTTIPAGQNAVAIPVTVIDDNVYETPETLSLTLTGGTSANFSFAASGSSATATVNITDDDKQDQVITFSALPEKTLGDPAFTLNATGGASGKPVTYTSSNPAVATISGNTVTIVGVGTANIIASQAGNATYHAAPSVTQVLTVLVPPNTAPTLAAIANQQLCFTNTMQTVALSGITAGTETNQTITLSVSSNNTGLFSALAVTQPAAGNAVLNYTLNNSAGGTATITLTVKDNGGTLNGGTDTFGQTFTLLVSALPQLHIEATPGTSVSKGQTLELRASGATAYTWENAAGIITGQNSAMLTVRPAQTTTYTVTGTNAAGCTSTASITITVIEDYNLVANNVLTPNGDGKNDFFVVQNIDMYPNNELRVFDRAGRAIYSKRGYNNEWDGTINGTPLHEETYYYIIDLGQGVKPKKGFISIVRKY